MTDARKRRPKPKDLEELLELMWDGNSLRAACERMGLHVPSTSDWLHEDARSEQYARAREGRAEFLAEDALAVNRAAALGLKVGTHTVDPSGAKGYLDAAKWQTARMAPKTAPIERHAVSHEFGSLSEEDIDARIAAKLGGAGVPGERAADEG